MSSKKKPKVKRRRSLSRAELFPKKATTDDILYKFMKQKLESTFPDRMDRMAYVHSLIQGLEEEEDRSLC